MQGAEASPEKPIIYFIKLARFSNTNAYVEAQLRLRFPEASLRILDLKRLLERPSWPLLKAVAAALIALGRERLQGRPRAPSASAALLQKLLRDPSVFDFMSRSVRRAIERERRRVWFTIQTQSLWNGAARGIPHFVYTDSTVLANLYFKHADFACVPSAAWLDCERAIYTEAARTFVMSGHVARSLTELYGIEPRKVAQVYVGANLERPPTEARPAPADNKTILFVGVEWQRKGGPELVQAFQRLPARHADARLLIVGVSPPLDAPRCDIVGRVPPQRIGEYYAQAAIFCMPTRLEPFGIAFIEAMMHSLAVAAPRQGAMLDYIREQDTGVLYDPGDGADIARALTWLLDHPLERQAMAARGFEVARTRYTWDAVGRRLHDEIRASVAGRAVA
jgi:glycosyltransferase involved in cell wall biosynthesis